MNLLFIKKTERNWNMWVPGFGSEDLKPYKKASTTEAHKQVCTYLLFLGAYNGEIRETCHSVTFYFTKINKFSDICIECILGEPS